MENPRSPVRRLVTGHDRNKVAKAIIDAPAANTRHGATGNASTLIWCTDAMPADISIGEDVEDFGQRKLGTPPPPNGTRFTVIDFPPGGKGNMHRTETVDYVVVIAGEIDMDMDDSTVHMKAGDVMVQRGANHAWINRGADWARVAFVLIDAEPLGIGHAVGRGASAG
jgi:quercetin dioxygenase-like cupin family protein